jgi:hypothetical protein
MRTQRKPRRARIVSSCAILAAIAIATALGTVGTRPALAQEGVPGHNPIWSEVKWPFAPDLWGPGLAFHCAAADCGSEVHLYLRAKLGFCNCMSVIDDELVDKVGDVDLLGGGHGALGPGRPIDVRWMKGRSRGYRMEVPGATAAKSALSIAFHDRCDLIVATAAVAGDRSALPEAAVLAFLGSDRVLRWLEVTLGL